jgi:hypothetical protein
MTSPNNQAPTPRLERTAKEVADNVRYYVPQPQRRKSIEIVFSSSASWNGNYACLTGVFIYLCRDVSMRAGGQICSDEQQHARKRAGVVSSVAIRLEDWSRDASQAPTGSRLRDDRDCLACRPMAWMTLNSVTPCPAVAVDGWTGQIRAFGVWPLEAWRLPICDECQLG